LPTDNLLVVAKTEDEISQLEVYIYDESSENLYVHHDLMLPNFPLCLEWLDFPPVSSASPTSASSQFGNFVAVGTLDPEIEIWSLDVVDPMYPDALLGRPDLSKAHVPTAAGTGKKKRKKAKHRTTASGWHVDAVLALSWNRTHRSLLASASADRTVKLWDLTRCGAPSARQVDGDEEMDAEGPAAVLGGEGAGQAIRSFDNVHKDKVQAVQWNDREPTVLLTGSYDRTVRTFDTRAPDEGVGAVVGADVEALRWDPWESHSFYVSTLLLRLHYNLNMLSQVSLENGLVLNFDARTLPSSSTFLTSPSPSRFTLQAHDGAVSAIDVNPHIPGCIATGGTDKVVKVWNVNTGEDGNAKSVSLVTSRDLGVVCHSICLSRDDTYTYFRIGQSFHSCVLARRPSDTCGGRLKGKNANLGCWSERRCSKGLRTKTCCGRASHQGKRRRRCCRRTERRRGQWMGRR
jgi:periodic tryptophan protein 1